MKNQLIFYNITFYVYGVSLVTLVRDLIAKGRRRKFDIDIYIYYKSKI